MNFKIVLFILIGWSQLCYSRNDHKDGSVGTQSEREEYIISLKRQIKDRKPSYIRSDMTRLRQELEERFSMKIKDYARFGDQLFLIVKGTPEGRDKLVKELEGVRYSEPNSRLYAFDGSPSNENTCIHQDVSDIWGLNRIDQRERLTSETKYSYSDSDDGSGVVVYVVDTGIYTDHPEFEGRATWGYTTRGMDGDSDLNGHGTHVAGTIGSARFGVAKKTKLIAVKVLAADGSGRIGGILTGFGWIIDDMKIRGSTKKYVINLSLGLQGVSIAVDAAVKYMISLGVPVVIAAGNDHVDACGVSPARVPGAITVGATDSSDRVADFSNWGECLDLFAPGVHIESTYIKGFYSRRVSGTSQATPHVAGLVARYLSTRLDDVVTPDEVHQWVVNISTKNSVIFNDKNEQSSPNRLAYMHCYHEGEQWVYAAANGVTIPMANFNLLMIIVLLSIILLRYK